MNHQELHKTCKNIQKHPHPFCMGRKYLELAMAIKNHLDKGRTRIKQATGRARTYNFPLRRGQNHAISKKTIKTHVKTCHNDPTAATIILNGPDQSRTGKRNQEAFKSSETRENNLPLGPNPTKIVKNMQIPFKTIQEHQKRFRTCHNNRKEAKTILNEPKPITTEQNHPAPSKSSQILREMSTSRVSTNHNRLDQASTIQNRREPPRAI